MPVELRERLIEYMAKCRLCTIATVSADGQPGIATVFFRNKGLDIYFNTGRQTQKVQNILANPRVALVVQETRPVPEVDQDIRGIQYVGQANILSDIDTAEVPKAVVVRHNAFNSVKPGDSIIVRVTPARLYFIDYARGFRHRELLEF